MSEIKNLTPERNYWKEEEEKLLKQWADKAKCYQWLHNKSREIYQRKNAWFTIPVIIISTIVGTANFALDRFPEENRHYVVIAIGSLSIIAGIITTIYQFLKISELNEGHRVSLLSWGKFHVDIESELSRHPLDRMPASELIKISKSEFNRLIEISPFIPKKVLKEFNSKFKNSVDLIKPEIGNNINPMNMFEMNEENRQKMINELNKGLIIKNKEIVEKKVEKDNKVNKFRKSFFVLNNREPTLEEIKKNMKYTDIHNYDSSDESLDKYEIISEVNSNNNIDEMEEDSYDSYNNEDILNNNIDNLNTNLQDNIKSEENLDLDVNINGDNNEETNDGQIINLENEEENENNNLNDLEKNVNLVDIEEDDNLSGENIVINIESGENNKVIPDNNKKYLMKNSTAV